MANKKPPTRRKGYFGNVRWTFNARVRTTLISWMRTIRARIWLIAPLVAMAAGADRDPVTMATIVLLIALASVIVQIIVESATDRPAPRKRDGGDTADDTCKTNEKE